MVYYKIFPRCGASKNLALTYNSDDPDNRALLKVDASLDTQLWALIEVIKGTDHGFALLNKSSNMVLAAPKNNAKLQAISQGKLFDADKEYDSHTATWRWSGVGYGALQLQRNTDMNLNVWNDPDKCKDGDSVRVWDWTHGKYNEVWEFRAVV